MSLVFIIWICLCTNVDATSVELLVLIHKCTIHIVVHRKKLLGTAVGLIKSWIYIYIYILLHKYSLLVSLQWQSNETWSSLATRCARYQYLPQATHSDIMCRSICSLFFFLSLFSRLQSVTHFNSFALRMPFNYSSLLEELSTF